MALIITKALVDGIWYLAFMMPVIVGVPDAAAVILTALPFIWAAYLILWRNRRDFFSDVEGMVLFEAKVLLGIGLFELLLLGPAAWQRLCGRYVLLFLLFGVFFLRVSRVSEAEGKGRFFGINGAYLLGTLLAAVVLASETLRDGVVYLLKTAYFQLILPLLERLIWALAYILSALVSFLSGLFPGSGTGQEMEAMELNFENSLGLEEVSDTQVPVFLKVFGYLLLALAVAAVLYFLYRKLSGDALGWNQKAAGTLTRTQEQEQKRSTKRGGLFGGERGVRYYYRKCLAACVKKGLDMEQPVTSREVCDFSAQYWETAKAEELRNLYLEVRYGFKEENVSDKKRAKDLWQSFLKTDSNPT
ncbi:MAG: hypothetical protein LUG99_14115 [Lachnospiraceae bacterium]|nr:hypothetical protein [Lachnospiraceae bacterium]